MKFLAQSFPQFLMVELKPRVWGVTSRWKKSAVALTIAHHRNFNSLTHIKGQKPKNNLGTLGS